MAKKIKEPKRREKKQRKGKKHMSLKPHEYYDVSSGEVRRNRNPCPRCGPGNWLAVHRGRLYCGKCGYTEFEKKPGPGQSENPEVEEKKEKMPEATPEKPSGNEERPSGKPEEKPEQTEPTKEEPTETRE